MAEYLDFTLLNFGDYTLRVYSLLIMLSIFVVSKVVLAIIKKAMFNSRLFKIEQGNAYALFQIIRYIIWVIASVLMLESIGVQVTVLLAGSAALLVGVGLGLQQTFNDILSGIILLVEGTTKVGDILQIDDMVVKIESIGLRTSTGINRDNITVVLPNSQITTNKVINWTHQTQPTRFKISVGVAYGSDTEKVVKILKDSAYSHPEIKKENEVAVEFKNFGSSSLDFNLYFYSDNIFYIDKIKSEIRLIINKKFIENGIIIPFNQLDVHLKR
jgi:small-conductance mechanosensitive channel